MNANSIWNESGSRPEFPANGTVWERLNFAVKCAGMAVAMDEWQPWHFRIRDDVVELSGRPANHAAAGAEARHDDESLRQVIMRCGFALYHLRLVLKNFGCLGKVELFPDLAESGLIAKIYHSGTTANASPCRAGVSTEIELFQAMNPGHVSMNSHPASGRKERGVDGGLLEAFEERLGFYVADKAWLEFAACENSHKRLASLASPTVRPAARPKGWLTFIMGSGERSDFRVETDGQRADTMAALGMIKTKTDDKHGWLAAGQMMAKAALQARAWQVASHAFDQGFRDRKLREELRTTIGHKGYVQAAFGLGSHKAEETDNGWLMVDRAEQRPDDSWDMRY